MKKFFDVIKEKLFVKKDKIHSEKYYRTVDFFNKTCYNKVGQMKK